MICTSGKIAFFYYYMLYIKAHCAKYTERTLWNSCNFLCLGWCSVGKSSFLWKYLCLELHEKTTGIHSHRCFADPEVPLHPIIVSVVCDCVLVLWLIRRQWEANSDSMARFSAGLHYTVPGVIRYVYPYSSIYLIKAPNMRVCVCVLKIKTSSTQSYSIFLSWYYVHVFSHKAESKYASLY